jgi:hypothetical protein
VRRWNPKLNDFQDGASKQLADKVFEEGDRLCPFTTYTFSKTERPTNFMEIQIRPPTSDAARGDGALYTSAICAQPTFKDFR